MLNVSFYEYLVKLRLLMDHRTINLLSYNVRSLIDRSRQIDLLNTLKKNNIDIGFVQECHLRRNQKVNLSGYNFLYDFSPLGVAILIKNSLKYQRIVVNDFKFNAVFIQVDMKSNDTCKKYLFGSIYIPCNMATADLNDSLNKLLQLTIGFDGFLFGGDLNAKNASWGDVLENGNGKILFNWLQDNSMDVIRICDSAPSYPNGSSYLDHFLLSPHLVDLNDINYEISTLPTFSDHFPLKLKLRTNTFNFLLRNARVYTSYKNTIWENFRNELESAILSIMPPSNRNILNNEIELFIEKFNITFSAIHENHSEKVEARDNKPPLSDSNKHLYKVKHQWQKELKKIFHRNWNRLSREYNILSKQIQLLQIIIRQRMKIEDGKFFGNRLQKIKPGPRAFKEIHQIVGKKKSAFCHHLIHNNRSTSCSSEIANIFQDYYCSTFQETIPERPVVNLHTRVDNCINMAPTHIYSFSDLFNSKENPDGYHFIGSGKIREIINVSNSKKSSGIDGISNFILKKFPEAALIFFTILFNNCINNCYFPEVWKSAKILPIKKKSNCKGPEDFRPISLLSNVGKIFENILREKIESEFVINPISEYQFGFRKCHSTQHALLKLHTDVVTNLREKSCTVAISLDIEKAFDSACHIGILHKMVDLGVDPYLVKLMYSYLADRKFMVQINNSSSQYGPVKSGVPQGSVLAPFLFNIFLHDFPHIAANSKAILYADDCIIYAHNDSPIQALNTAAYHLGLISVFYKTWGIKVNVAKSEAICFRNASGKCARYVVPQSKLLQLSLDGVDIPFKNGIKYLGIEFNKLLKFNNHARMALQKAKRIAGMFSRILHSKYLSQNTKLLLYKVAIRPVLLYGFPIWFTISPIVAKELEIFERRILRKCIDKNFENFTKRFSNIYIYTNSGVQPFCTYGFTLQRKFVERLEHHENSLLDDIYQAEKNTIWSESAYMSSVGILGYFLDNDPEHLHLPDFYKKTAPGSLRG